MASAHEAELIALIVKEAKVDAARLVRDASLKSLNLDSVDLVSVMFGIEDTYGVTLEDDEVRLDFTLGQLLDLVESKIAAKAS